MKKEFNHVGTFEAYWAAEAWCQENGISVAPMCYPYPTGLMRGNFSIAKYKNLTQKEIRTLDGTITGDFRDGPVFVELK